jgi:hypothetical protein
MATVEDGACPSDYTQIFDIDVELDENCPALYALADGIQSNTFTSTVFDLSSYSGASQWIGVWWDQSLNGGSITVRIISGSGPVVELSAPSAGDIAGVGSCDEKRISTFEITEELIRVEFVITRGNDGSKGDLYTPIVYAFGLMTDSPLPIELLTFKAECKDGTPLIKWSTATETNNEYFVIEESVDAVNFYEIGRVAGAGNSSSVTSYQLPVTSSRGDFQSRPSNSTLYYRLKQIDYDGKQKTFNIIAVNCEGSTNAAITVYPNPFDDEINIRFDNIPDEEIKVEIYDAGGKLIYSKMHKRTDAIGSTDAINCVSTITIHIGNILPGNYNVKIITKDKEYVNKLIKN